MIIMQTETKLFSIQLRGRVHLDDGPFCFCAALLPHFCVCAIASLVFARFVSVFHYHLILCPLLYFAGSNAPFSASLLRASPFLARQ